MLYCGKHGPTWQRGVVTKKERFVKVETLEGTNMFRLFDHVTVGIQLRGQEALSINCQPDNLFSGNESHANTLSYSLLDNKPWKGNDSSAESGQINFLQEAKLDKANSLNTEDSTEEPEEELEEKKPVKRRKKQKVNVYEFFEEMRQMGLRPPHSLKDNDMDIT